MATIEGLPEPPATSFVTKIYVGTEKWSVYERLRDNEPAFARHAQEDDIDEFVYKHVAGELTLSCTVDMLTDTVWCFAVDDIPLARPLKLNRGNAKR